MQLRHQIYNINYAAMQPHIKGKLHKKGQGEKVSGKGDSEYGDQNDR